MPERRIFADGDGLRLNPQTRRQSQVELPDLHRAPKRRLEPRRQVAMHAPRAHRPRRREIPRRQREQSPRRNH